MKFKSLFFVKFSGLLLLLAQNVSAVDSIAESASNSTTSSIVAGGGSGVGGGGDAVVFADDTVVLADPFYRPGTIEGQFHCESGQSTHFSETLNKEIK